jgi:hypothetical protein
MPSIHEQPDGKFIVTDHEGTPATFDNRQEAMEAAFAFITPQQRQKVIAMVEERQSSSSPANAQAAGQAAGPAGQSQKTADPSGTATPHQPPSAPPTMEQVQAEAARHGFMPPIHEQPDGKFIVKDHEGTPATFTNREEAVEASFAFMTLQQRQKVKAMVEESQRPKAATKKSRLQFSHGRETESPVDNSTRTPGQAMQALAENESRFRRGPASQSKDMNEIARQYAIGDELGKVYEGDLPYGENALKNYQLYFKAGGKRGQGATIDNLRISSCSQCYLSKVAASALRWSIFGW